jgi:glycerol-3-phosphate dehydrogenase
VAAREEEALWCVSCRDAGGRDSVIRARALVNATGAWVNDILQRLGIVPRQKLRLVKGSHLILRRVHEGDQACLLQSPDRRVVFMIPFERHYTLVGTTDAPYGGDPATPRIDAGETQYLLDCLNRFLRRPVGAADIVGSYSGVRPLYDDGSREAAQQVSRDYHLELQQGAAGAPVLTVYGGKITTYRRLAEHALERLATALPQATQVSHDAWTASEPLPGGDLPGGDLEAFTRHCLDRWPRMPSPLVERLARTYGTRTAQLLGGAATAAELGRDHGCGLTSSEIGYLIEQEWARSAEDILWRRTRLGLEFPDSGLAELQQAVAQRLG